MLIAAALPRAQAFFDFGRSRDVILPHSGVLRLEPGPNGTGLRAVLELAD